MPKSLLGFNFLVIEPNMPVTNIKHSIIYECTASLNISTNPGIISNVQDCSNAGKISVEKGTHKGVKDSFD